VREIFSIVVLLASYLGNRVIWRGSSMAAVAKGRESKIRLRKINMGKKISLDKTIGLEKTIGLNKTGRLSRGIDQL
jgi:hypothetical protein